MLTQQSCSVWQSPSKLSACNHAQLVVNKNKNYSVPRRLRMVRSRVCCQGGLWLFFFFYTAVLICENRCPLLNRENDAPRHKRTLNSYRTHLYRKICLLLHWALAPLQLAILTVPRQIFQKKCCFSWCLNFEITEHLHIVAGKQGSCPASSYEIYRFIASTLMRNETPPSLRLCCKSEVGTLAFVVTLRYKDYLVWTNLDQINTLVRPTCFELEGMSLNHVTKFQPE